MISVRDIAVGVDRTLTLDGSSASSMIYLLKCLKAPPNFFISETVVIRFLHRGVLSKYGP